MTLAVKNINCFKLYLNLLFSPEDPATYAVIKLETTQHLQLLQERV
jgi:hypothetical protein